VSLPRLKIIFVAIYSPNFRENPPEFLRVITLTNKQTDKQTNRRGFISLAEDGRVITDSVSEEGINAIGRVRPSRPFPP